MGYRQLGKTGFMISEISLGGHGGSSVEDRIAVLDKAVELGINYVDNNIDAECDLYGEAMAGCKHAPRDEWFIGFASWPEKITEEYEKELTPAGMMKNIEARLSRTTPTCSTSGGPWAPTWGPGQNNINTLLMVSRQGPGHGRPGFREGPSSRARCASWASRRTTPRSSAACSTTTRSSR